MDKAVKANIEGELRRRLENLRREHHEAETSTEVVTLDQSKVGRLSRMDAMQGQAMAQAAQRRRTVEIRQAEAALARLDDEDFGLCEECDQPIHPQRLSLNPALTTCIACATRAEEDSKA